MNKFNFLSVGVLLSILFTISGCAKRSDSESKVETRVIYEENVPVKKALSLEDATRMARTGVLNCDVGRTCNEQVGLLTVVVQKEEQFGVGQCTFFLVTESIIATNRHCVPDSLINLPDLVSQRMFAIFANSKTNIRVPVQSILKLSTDDYPINKIDPVLSMDYAFLRLSKNTNIKPLILSSKGLQSNLTVYSLSVDPVLVQNGVAGDMKIRRCSVIYNTIALPTFSKPYRPVATFTDCPIIPGNSGSPAVDDEGNVRAIINGTSTLKSAHHLAFGNNIACVKFPDELGYKNSLNQDCAILPDSTEALKEWQNSPVLSSERMEDFTVQFNTFLESNGAYIDSKYKWQIGSVDSKSELGTFLNEKQKISKSELGLGFVTVIPKCLVNISKWISSLEKTNSKGVKYFPEILKSKTKLPLWMLKISPNEYAQLEIKPSFVQDMEVEIQMSPKQIDDQKETEILITLIEAGMPKSILLSETISDCGRANSNKISAK